MHGSSLARVGAGLALVAIVMFAASCEGSGPLPDDAIAIRASTDLGPGRERLLVGIARPDGTRLGSPDLAVEFDVAPLDDPGASRRVPATFTWIIEGGTGIYRGVVEFDRPGTWTVAVVPDGGRPLDAIPFTVLDDTASPSVGDPAPPSDSPTLDDLTLEQLTTDPDPDPELYRMSIAAAVASGKPSVIIFSTPAYCQTGACGPVLETIKSKAASTPGVNFVHVEVYTGLDQPGFVPDAAHLAPAVLEWNLTSEPWVFVVDETGAVVARFEGVLDPAELDEHVG